MNPLETMSLPCPYDYCDGSGWVTDYEKCACNDDEYVPELAD